MNKLIMKVIVEQPPLNRVSYKIVVCEYLLQTQQVPEQKRKVRDRRRKERSRKGRDRKTGREESMVSREGEDMVDMLEDSLEVCG